MYEQNAGNELSVPAQTTSKPQVAVGLFSRISEKLSSFNRLGWAVLILVLALLAGAGFYLVKQYSSNQLGNSAFKVVGVSPKGSEAPFDIPITILFNRPVSPHHVEKFIEFNPPLNGYFEKGSLPSELVYKLNGQLPSSTVITVQIKAGLQSETGETIAKDYFASFTTKSLASSFYFTQSGINSKFMSFQTSKGVSMEVGLHGSVANPNLKIFKVDDPKIMLNSFRHTTETYNGYSSYGGYTELVVDSSNLELMNEITEREKIEKLNFKYASGLYLIEARDGDKVLNSVWISLSDIGVHFRQDDQNIYLAAQNLNTGVVENGLKLDIYKIGSTARLVQTNILNGLLTLPYAYPNTVDIVVATKGENIMVIPVNVPNTQASLQVYDNLNTKKTIFLYTERPIYQPGDKLFFRGLVRIDNDAAYRVPPAGTQIRISYSDNDAQWHDQIVTTLEDGSFYGEINLPTDSKDYQYYVLLASDATKPADENRWNGAQANFEVLEYVKPDFGLSVKTERDAYIRGDKIKAFVEGKYFSGQAMAGEKVSYTVYSRDYYETEKAVYNESFDLNSWGGMCGIGYDDEYYGSELLPAREVNLDVNGKATIEFNSSELPQPFSKEVVVVFQKKDAANNDINSAGKAVVHAGEFNIFLRPTANASIAGAPFKYIAYAENSTGQKLTKKKLNYDFYEVTYDIGEPKKTKLMSGTVETNSDGVAQIVGNYPNKTDVSINLVVSSSDSKNNIIETPQYIYLSNDRGPSSYQNTILSMSSAKSNFTPGEEITLEVESPVDIKAFLTMERGRVYQPRWIDIKKGKSTIKLPVRSNYVPSITPTFSFFYDGMFYIEGMSLNVPALDKVLNVDVRSDKNNYRIGDTAFVSVRTTDANGNPVSAKVGVGIVDKAIFALRKNATRPFHSSFYFFRARSTNVSSSLTWVTSNCECGGGGGGGDDSFGGKGVDTLYWNPDIQTGVDGNALVSVPVGNSETTWKVLIYGSTEQTDLGQGEAEFFVTK